MAASAPWEWRETASGRAHIPLAGMFWLAGTLVLACSLWRHRHFLHDDAFISLRYAVNLVEHGELAWNLGERVEGFTNLLHLLASAALIGAGMEPVPALRLIGVSSIVVIVAAFERATSDLASGPSGTLARALGGFLLLSSTPIALWALGGLEATFLAAALTAAFWLLARGLQGQACPGRPFLLAGTAFALAGAIRPDAALVVAAASAAVALWAPAAQARRWRAAIALLAPTIAAAIALTIWRLATFGDVVPNTFHVKVGVDAGSRLPAGAGYLLQALPYAPVIVLAAFAALRCRRSMGVAAAAPLAAVGAYTAYVVWAGGDHMPAARLFVPVLPLAALVLANSVARLPRREALAWSIAGLVAGAAAALFPGRQVMDPAAFVGRLVGQHIAGAWPAGSLVALNTAGSVPFYAPELRFIDMLGLNDRTIARRKVGAPSLYWQRLPGHGKGDGLYVLSRRPDFVILGPAEGRTTDRPWFLSDLELARSTEFRTCYRMEQARIPYGDAIAKQGPPRPRPLLFTYYRRTCE